MIISSEDHLPGRLGKIDLVPIKKMNSSKEWNEENDS
jgi:hypothetical protein